MKIKQTVIMLALALFASASVGVSLASPVQGATCGTNAAGQELETAIIGGDICNTVTDDGTVEGSGVWALLLFALTVMTAGVGILAVGGIVWGAVLYTSAADKPEQTKKAINIITNVVIGIVAYALMYLGLNFLIPGGIFA